MNELDKQGKKRCVFINGTADGVGVQCNTQYALRTQSDGLEGIFTPLELKSEMCDGESTQCEVYKDLTTHGKGSVYSK